MRKLSQQHCYSADAGLDQLKAAQIAELKPQLDDEWHLSENGLAIERLFRFSDYYETMAFVNAVAWIAHSEDHHPTMQVSANKCLLTWTTHSVDGLSMNDFICAAKVDDLLGFDLL